MYATALNILAVAVLGCSSSGDRRVDEDPGGPAESAVVGSTAPQTENIEAVYDSPSIYPVDAEWRALLLESIDLASIDVRAGREEDRRIDACMRSRGFDYETGTMQGQEVDGRVAANPLNEATLPLGYHSPPQPEFVGGTTEITPEMELALDGGDIPPDGPPPSYAKGEEPCVIHQDIVALTEPLDAVFDSYTILAVDLSDRVSRYDLLPEAKMLNEEWSACMAKNGHQYADRQEAIQTFANAPTIEEVEVRVRTADYECDLAIGITRQRSEWQRREYDSWLIENALAIDEVSAAIGSFSDALTELEAETLE